MAPPTRNSFFKAISPNAACAIFCASCIHPDTDHFHYSESPIVKTIDGRCRRMRKPDWRVHIFSMTRFRALWVKRNEKEIISRVEKLHTQMGGTRGDAKV